MSLRAIPEIDRVYRLDTTELSEPLYLVYVTPGEAEAEDSEPGWWWQDQLGMWIYRFDTAGEALVWGLVHWDNAQVHVLDEEAE